MIEKLKSERGREWLFGILLGLGLLTYAAWQLQHLQGFQWSTDEGIYLMRVRLLQRGYRLYTDVWTDQLPGMIELLRVWFALLERSSAEVGRALVVLLTLPGLLGTALITRRVAGRSGALLTLPLLALAPNVYWLSRAIVSPDLPSISLGIAALALIGIYARRRRIGLLIAAGLVLALGLYIKATAVLVIPAGVVWLYVEADGTQGRRPVWRDVVIWGLSAALPLGVALLFHDVPALWRQFVGTQVASGQMELKIGPHAVKILRYLGEENNWGLAILALVGAVMAVALRSQRSAKGVGASVLLTWLGTSVLVLLVRSPMWPSHHLVVLLPCLAVLAGMAATRVWSAVVTEQGGRWERMAVLGCLIYGLSLPGMAYADLVLSEAPSYASSTEAVAYLDERLPDDAMLISDYHMLPYRAGLLVPPELATFSKKRLQLDMLGPEQLIAMTDNRAPPGVVMWDEKLAEMSEYADWVVHNYALGLKLSYHRIYVRPDALAGWHEQRALLGDRVRLLGYDLSDTAVDPGDMLRVTLYWQVLADEHPLYAGFVHMVDGEGASLAQADHVAFGEWYPSEEWQAGELIADDYELLIPDDGAAGNYWLSVGLYDRETKHRLETTAEDGEELPGDQITLAIQPVVRWSADWEGAPLASPVGARFGEVGHLVSYETDLQADADQLVVDLQWQGGSPPDWPGYVAYVHLRQEGELVSQDDRVPGDGTRPTQAWRQGEFIADRHVLSLAEVPPGEYELYVGLYDPAAGDRVPVTTAEGEMLPSREIVLQSIAVP